MAPGATAAISGGASVAQTAAAAGSVKSATRQVLPLRGAEGIRAASAGVAMPQTGANAVGQQVAAESGNEGPAGVCLEAVSPSGETASVGGAEDAAPRHLSEPGWARACARQQATQAATAVHAIPCRRPCGRRRCSSLRDESIPQGGQPCDSNDPSGGIRNPRTRHPYQAAGRPGDQRISSAGGQELAVRVPGAGLLMAGGLVWRSPSPS